MKEQIVQLYYEWCNTNLSDHQLAEKHGIEEDHLHLLLQMGKYYYHCID